VTCTPSASERSTPRATSSVTCENRNLRIHSHAPSLVPIFAKRSEPPLSHESIAGEAAHPKEISKISVEWLSIGHPFQTLITREAPSDFRWRYGEVPPRLEVLDRIDSDQSQTSDVEGIRCQFLTSTNRASRT
jgi:hypothetical protein